MQVYGTNELFSPEIIALSAKPARQLSLNSQFQNLLVLVCEAVPEFRTYDARKIAVSIGRSKSKGKFGVWAHVAPLRYLGGKKSRRTQIRGTPGSYVYETSRIEEKYPGAMYLMTFILPKFFRLSFEERIETVVHELYHLHPEFRGDLRRFQGPNIYHGPTPAAFKRRVRELAQKALANFSELKNHPLLHFDEIAFSAQKYFRVDLPRRVFMRDTEVTAPHSTPQNSPAQGSLWDVFKKIVLGSVLVFGSFAFAQEDALTFVEVRVQNKGYLYTNPDTRAIKLRALRGNEVYVAFKQSMDKNWVYIQDNLGSGGWIQRGQLAVIRRSAETILPKKLILGDDEEIVVLPDDGIERDLEGVPRGTAPPKTFTAEVPATSPKTKANETASAVAPAVPSAPVTPLTAGASGLDDELSLLEVAKSDEEIEDPIVVDPKKLPDQLGISKDAFLNRNARMYINPNPQAERTGRLERDDLVTILEQSPQVKWVRVRLKETGEEGWIPVKWLEEVRPDQTLGKFFEVQLFHAELTGSYGTKEHNAGLGMGMFFRGRRPISEGSWVRNLQAGIESTYYVGNKTSVTVPNTEPRAFSVRYLVTSVLARFVFSPRKSDFAFGPEAGIAYQKAFVSTNIDSADLATEKISENPSYLGLVGGIRAFWGVSDRLYCHGAVRGYFMTDSFVTIDVGAGLKF